MKGENHTKETQNLRPTQRVFFVMLLETLFIFAVPAFLVLGAGVYLNISRGMLFILLGGAFILSWTFVALKVRKLHRSAQTWTQNTQR